MNASSHVDTLLFFGISNSYFIFIIVLLLLILIGLYFYFTAKLVKQNIEFSETIYQAKKKESVQNALLSDLSDNIYNLSKNLVHPDEKHSTSVESKILTSANNLRELLKVQANKIEPYVKVVS